MRQLVVASSSRGSGCSARRGSVAGSILTTGPIITSCQSGPRCGDAGEQREVHALVDHAEEAKARMRDGRLVRRIAARCAGLREVRDVDAARKRVDVGMAMPLGFVERLAAGEHQIGARASGSLRRRAGPAGRP